MAEIVVMKATKRKPHHQKPSDDNDLEGGSHTGGAVNMGVESQEDDDIVYSYGLTSEECDNLLRIHGKNELPERTISNWFIIMNLLLEPMPVMIWLAVIIEAVLLKWTDMTILLGIQLANASISFYEISKAGNAVAALKVLHTFMFLILFLLLFLIMLLFLSLVQFIFLFQFMILSLILYDVSVTNLLLIP